MPITSTRAEQFNANSDNDALGLNRGQTFGTLNDLNRLEVIGANEGAPLDERLQGRLDTIGRAADRVGEQRAVTRATIESRRASDLDKQQLERATRGMDLSDRQKRTANRRLGLSRSLNRAQATGDVRRGFTNRAKIANRFGGGLSDALFSQRASAETDIAASFAADKADKAERKAAKKRAIIGTVGKIAGAALMFMSSEKVKDNLGHEPQLLAKLKKVRVNRWNYKGDKTEHIGPLSEEFNREFKIKTATPDRISMIDALGIALGAVKELDKKVSAHGI